MAQELMELGDNDLGTEGICPHGHASTPTKRVSGVDVEHVRRGIAAVSMVDSPRSRSKSKSVKTKRKLFTKERVSQPPWTVEETKSLLCFLMLHTDGKSWMSHKDFHFWEKAGAFIQFRVHSPHLRSGNACRTRVVGNLAKEFPSPADAERHYSSPQPSSVTPPAASEPPLSPVGNPADASTPNDQSPHEHSIRSSDPLSTCTLAISRAPPSDRIRIVSSLFSKCLRDENVVMTMPEDFLEQVIMGLKNLRSNKRSNIIYSLTKGIATLRQDGSDTLFPLKRMPAGLVEYTVNFFVASSTQKVKCPPDYRAWLQTLYILFGTKFSKIFTGPLWSHAPIMQSESVVLDGSTSLLNPAMVNVPAISDRTIRRDIASSGISIGSEIQTAVLAEAAASDPDAKWWIKADGCDVVKGLCESTKGVWSGDVDLNNGELQKLYRDHLARLEFIDAIGVNGRAERGVLNQTWKKCCTTWLKTWNFAEMLSGKTKEYQDKLSRTHSHPEQVMFSLCWEIEELNALSTSGRLELVEIQTLIDLLCKSQEHIQSANLPRRLSVMKTKMTEFVKKLSRFRRTAATHIFVIMVSSELRNQKPYALPVQCLPYAGMNEKHIRRLISSLIREMVKIGMSVRGFVSNGEFNYLRTKGNVRPLSVLQIRSEVRKRYSQLGARTLTSMLTPVRMPGGTIVAQKHNPAVPADVLRNIYDWMEQGATFEDVIDRLRPRTVPSGYTYSNWKSGEEETLHTKMKSILAQLEYTYQIRTWQSKGVPFDIYLYVPEIHPDTNATFYEQEDAVHLLKRIATHTRNGGPQDLHLEHYVDALNDSSSGLTYPAFTGARKQSVPDAERMFSTELALFMKAKGYEYEATYIQTVCNWHRACDERGLTELTRCKYDYEFLNLMLDELMPWHKEYYDFGLLEVNKIIKGILGFSRETLAALITGIEGRESRRRECVTLGYPPEHPRSSTTDDVECFFSVMRDAIGKNFTSKEVQYGFRKMCVEFKKRINPDLPFYYHTSSHTRFQEGPLPSFNQPSSRPKRKHKRAPRREQPAAFAPGRASMPVSGSMSVRARFHNQPVELPPPPTIPIHVTEHAYCNQQTK